jgi:acyl-phosphate glycerol 3-phosphate acyltransferase
VRRTRLLTALGLGYVLGTLPSADVVARVVSGGKVDLRASGSRNPGAVNAGRVLGATPGRAVMVADVAKGYLSCAGGKSLAGDLGSHVAGFGAVLGHCYPAGRGFDGGKGLATTFGQSLHTFPVAAPIELGLAIGVARIPGLRQPGLVATTTAASALLGMSLAWWRGDFPNSWGPRPTAALFAATSATVAVVASRFALAHRRGDPDDLEPPRHV